MYSLESSTTSIYLLSLVSCKEESVFKKIDKNKKKFGLTNRKRIKKKFQYKKLKKINKKIIKNKKKFQFKKLKNK
jgi:hypothetical protein